MPSSVTFVAEIHDRYIVGTRLRLRRMDAEGEVLHKLAQKVRDDPSDPERVRLTNIYLDDAEYRALRDLPALDLRKTRLRTVWADRPVAIDRFVGRLDGLLLAEVELEVDDTLLPLPPWATGDVTGDDRFSGGALAAAGADTIAALIDQASRPC